MYRWAHENERWTHMKRCHIYFYYYFNHVWMMISCSRVFPGKIAMQNGWCHFKKIDKDFFLRFLQNKFQKYLDFFLLSFIFCARWWIMIRNFFINPHVLLQSNNNNDRTFDATIRLRVFIHCLLVCDTYNDWHLIEFLEML